MEDSHRSPHNDNGHSPYDALKRALTECLAVSDATGFEEQEAALMGIANNAVRDVLAKRLQERANELPKDVLVDGVRYRKHQLGTVLIHSLCGSFELKRWTYRRVGERNGPTCVPVEVEAGIVERSTPALAYGLICGYGKWHTRDHERMLLAAHRQAPSRSTLERIAKALGRRANELTPKIEPLLRKTETMPDGAHGIVLGLDRTTIPMEENPDPATRMRVRRTRQKPYVRSAPPPVVVNYRMAYVATVTIVDRAGEPLRTRRYAVGAHRGPAPIIRRMRRDLRWSLTRKNDLVVGVVQDGAAELRNLMLDALRAEPLVRKYHFVIDFYHVTERLGLVLKLIESDEDRRRKQMVRWRRALLRNDHAIYEICKRLERILHTWRENPSKRRVRNELFGHYSYLQGHAFRMRYARIASLGIPVGSGITEGACKSMIMSRLKRSGQRWRPEGVDAVLALRSLLESERLPGFWQHFQRAHRATLRAA